MTGISTATDIPDFPMARAPGCPFAPPPKALQLNEGRQSSRVRIWNGSTPWLIHGYDAIRSLFTDSRTCVDDRLPGYAHWNEGMVAMVHKSDYPHNESTCRYSESSPAAVVDAVGPEDAIRLVGGNIKKFLGI